MPPKKKGGNKKGGGGGGGGGGGAKPAAAKPAAAAAAAPKPDAAAEKAAADAKAAADKAAADAKAAADKAAADAKAAEEKAAAEKAAEEEAKKAGAGKKWVGVEVENLSAGDGKTFPQKGDKLKMHYTGTLRSTGAKFDSSRDRDEYFEFTIGRGQVIKGWDEGILKMSLGQRANLNIASDFGYGKKGSGANIPPDSDLIFDVELVAINGKQFKYTADQVAKFREKLEAWRDKQLAKYDDSEAFAEKTNKKYTDRAGYEKYLNAEVESSMAAHQ